MSRVFSSFLIAVIILLFYGCTTRRLANEFSENLNANLDTLKQISPEAGGKPIYNPDIITQLYEKGGNLLSAKWESRDKIEQMMTAIRNASLDGLNPDDYHLPEIERLTREIVTSDKPDAEDISHLEFLLTDAFVLLASHLSEGKTNPETIYPEWNISKRTLRQDWNSFIDSTLNSKNIIGTLQSLTPRHADYNNLTKALAEYRLLEEKGGWGSFSTSLPKLELGIRHPDVVKLRKRLSVTQGNIDFDPDDENLFDRHLCDQVVIFQQRNGLDPDGVAGKATIKALNISVGDRIETIEANLERWRWISDNLGQRYIRVNIANFDLAVLENDKQVFQSKAIVGNLYLQTPVFSSNLKYLVLNPEWVIPPTILKEEIIPVLVKNRTYLAKNNMKILRLDGTEADTSSVSWNGISPDNFPYMIRQDPGPYNPLGRIKFVFPNQYDVYIHDTPSRSLFSLSNRTLSHGCIRINKAFKLAEYLLKGSPGWDSVRIQKAIDEGIEKIIVLPKSLPVHIMYLTAWADDSGTAYFTNDVYDRDRILISALKQIAPDNISRQTGLN